MFAWKFIIILLVVYTNGKCVNNEMILWSPTNCEAGRSFFARLGDTSQPYLFPWLTELVILTRPKSYTCTGALINDRYVITAQSCVLPPVQPSNLLVNLGFSKGHLPDGFKISHPMHLNRTASHFILHPQYNPNNPLTAGNNLALIRLQEPAQYSKTIYPIKLPSITDQFLNFPTDLTDNIEWHHNEIGMKELIERRVQIQECSRTKAEICCVNVGSDNGFSPCEAESGGLLTITHPRIYNITVLIGIAGPNPPPLASCPPRVYSRIDRKISWIKENTQDGNYCRH